MPSIDILQVRGNGFIRYREQYRDPNHKGGAFCRAMDALKAQKAAERMEKARGSAYQVGMSEGSRKRLQRAVTILAAACVPRWVTNHKGQLQYFRMAFLTCTFPKDAAVTVNQAKEIFSLYMRWIREKIGVRADLWKLELTAAEVPHFHVLLSDYVNIREAQSRWDQLLREYGVTAAYAAREGTYKTSGVDISPVGKVNDLAAYMMKEIMKDLKAKKVAIRHRILADNPGISQEDLKKQLQKELQEAVTAGGKIWDCSQNLRGVRYYSVVMTAQHIEMLHKMEAENRADVFSDDFFSIIKLKDTSPPDLLSAAEQRNYQKHVAAIFEKEEPPVLEIAAAAMPVQADPKKTYTWEQIKLWQN